MGCRHHYRNQYLYVRSIEAGRWDTCATVTMGGEWLSHKIPWLGCEPVPHVQLYAVAAMAFAVTRKSWLMRASTSWPMSSVMRYGAPDRASSVNDTLPSLKRSDHALTPARDIQSSPYTCSPLNVRSPYSFRCQKTITTSLIPPTVFPKLFKHYTSEKLRFDKKTTTTYPSYSQSLILGEVCELYVTLRDVCSILLVMMGGRRGWYPMAAHSWLLRITPRGSPGLTSPCDGRIMINGVTGPHSTSHCGEIWN